MPQVEANVTSPVHDSFRVQQIAGMFDVPLASRSRETFVADIPTPDDSASEQPWQIGLIVGPSGSGKSTIAREAFGDAVDSATDWPRDRAVVDGFDDGLSTQAITRLLTSVGFSSPPSWIKPYHVLSGGERFRCDLARALARGLVPASRLETDEALEERHSQTPLVVFDEFTSVVDRTVARIASAAASKSIRRGHIPCRFVAVTCHHDVAAWLGPDWIVDMSTGKTSWRRLRRPPIDLHVHRCKQAAWPLFARHHYLSGSLSPGARCFVALWKKRPVAFAATVSMIGRRGRWRISRLVTLPDFQGVGIGMKLATVVANIHHSEGHQVSVTASHPALISHCRRSESWRARRVMKTGSRSHRVRQGTYCGSPSRAVVSFEYVGKA